MAEQGADTADWGYIEGYFGRLLDWPQRRRLLDVMAEHRLGTWIYAPKEDPLHRRRWREPYDDRWCGQFADFCTAAGQRGVRVVAAVSPGLDIRYGDEAELLILQRKFARLQQLGAAGLGLFFDDLQLLAAQADAALAAGQVAVAERLRARLPEPPASWWFCPTQYCDYLTGQGVEKSDYLRALRALDRSMRLLWTGGHVVSPQLNADSLAGIRALMPGRIALWDNCYANDYAPRRLILSPYRGRDRSLPLLLNPTGLPCTDGFYLALLGRHARGQPAEQAFAEELAAQGAPSAMTEPAADFFALGGAGDRGAEAPWPAARNIAAMSDERLRAQADALSRLAFGDWSSPLHREWYPFLQGARQDIQTLLARRGGRVSDRLLRAAPPALRPLHDD